MDDDATVARNPLAIYTEIDGVIALLDESTEDGDFLELTDLGADIWGRLESPMRLADLIEQLSSAYNVSSEQVRTDLVPFLDDLSGRGLLVAPGA